MGIGELSICGWKFYVNLQKQHILMTEKCGKWMYFVEDSEEGIMFSKNICKKAVEEGVTCGTKYTAPHIIERLGSGVCCFFCDGSDYNAHRKIIQFFLNNNMIRKTKNENFFNISFKYEFQTENNEYGNDFIPKLSLKDFIDLKTGEWLKNKPQL